MKGTEIIKADVGLHLAREGNNIVGFMDTKRFPGEVWITRFKVDKGSSFSEGFAKMVGEVVSSTKSHVICDVPDDQLRIQLAFRAAGFRCKGIVRRRNGDRYRFIKKGEGK